MWNLTKKLPKLLILHLRCFIVSKNSRDLCTFGVKMFGLKVWSCTIFDKSHVSALSSLFGKQFVHKRGELCCAPPSFVIWVVKYKFHLLTMHPLLRNYFLTKRTATVGKKSRSSYLDPIRIGPGPVDYFHLVGHTAVSDLLNTNSASRKKRRYLRRQLCFLTGAPVFVFLWFFLMISAIIEVYITSEYLIIGPESDHWECLSLTD